MNYVGSRTFLAYKIIDKNNKEPIGNFNSRIEAYEWAKENGYQRVYGMRG